MHLFDNGWNAFREATGQPEAAWSSFGKDRYFLTEINLTRYFSGISSRATEVLDEDQRSCWAT
jgi:hypothetical protein